MADSDATVIGASLDDPRALVAIFERHFDSINRYLRRRLSRVAADDLAAEVFATAFSRRTAYDLNRPDALPWLYGIAANLMRSRARMEERELRALARTGVDRISVTAADPGAGGPLEPVLAAALLDLGAADREALLLFALGDLGYDQIAVALGLPVGTVKSRLNRARRLVRRRLNERSPAEEAAHG
jgi:DNA-directed RNA polymerase specialized sigma24 family protein